MSSHAITYSSLHLRRSKIFFLTRTTQQVKSRAGALRGNRVVVQEIGRALAALAALAAWVGVIALFS
jgi:hypothetical protein